MSEFSFEITEEPGVIWESDKGGIQIEVNMIYNNVLTVPTNRIDTIVIDSVITDVTAGIENLIIN